MERRPGIKKSDGLQKAELGGELEVSGLFPKKWRPEQGGGYPGPRQSDPPSFVREAAGIQEFHHHVAISCAMGIRNGEINSENCLTSRGRGLSTSNDSKSTFPCWFPSFSDLKIQISSVHPKKKSHCLILYTVFNTIVYCHIEQ